MQNRKPKTIVMQGTFGYGTPEKENSDTVFDLILRIDMYIDGDWVRTRGTTLVLIMVLGCRNYGCLESNDIPHPAIGAAVDEETGMTGALELKGGILRGLLKLGY
jgi:dipeptidase D